MSTARKRATNRKQKPQAKKRAAKSVILTRSEKAKIRLKCNLIVKHQVAIAEKLEVIDKLKAQLKAHQANVEQLKKDRTIAVAGAAQRCGIDPNTHNFGLDTDTMVISHAPVVGRA